MATGECDDSGICQFPLSVRVSLLAIFSAVGIVLRQVNLPFFPPIANLTPGFTMPLLIGIVLGPFEGLIGGLVVGISGALWEIPLIPIIGNVLLALSTGIPTAVRSRISRVLWMILCIVFAIFIGGFLPTYLLSLIYLVPPVTALAAASLDAFQAGLWVVVALIIDFTVVQPLLKRFLPKTPCPHYQPKQ